MAGLRQAGVLALKLLLVCMALYIVINFRSFTTRSQQSSVYYVQNLERTTYAPLSAAAPQTPTNLTREPPPDPSTSPPDAKGGAATSVAEAGEGEAKPPARPKARMSYAGSCKWEYKEPGGYPSVAFTGELGDYVCPTMFRDLSDYVYGWPYKHFGEDVQVMDSSRIADNLPPVGETRDPSWSTIDMISHRP
jgi:hypothetical protein